MRTAFAFTPQTMSLRSVGLILALAVLGASFEAQATGKKPTRPIARYADGTSAQTPEPLTPQAQCPTVRLDQQPNGISRVPIHDQGGTGICFAYSASELIDSWRFSHPRSDGSIIGG